MILTTSELLAKRYAHMREYAYVTIGGGVDYYELVDTCEFTKNLDQISILSDDHPFITYLNGFLHGMGGFTILHGYCHDENLVILIEEDEVPLGCYSGISIAWEKWVKIFNSWDCQVHIFSFKHGQIEYDTDFNQPAELLFYKWFIRKVLKHKL